MIVKDLSELRHDESAALITGVAHDVAKPSSDTVYLLAANHGQLLEKLKTAPDTPEVRRLSAAVEDLLVSGATDDREVRLNLSDLSRAPAAKMTSHIIDEIGRHEGWMGCDGCPTAGDQSCPILENRKRLTGADGHGQFRKRLTSLVELSERNGGHFPIRQLLSLVSNVLLGHPGSRDGLMSCADGGQPGAQSARRLRRRRAANAGRGPSSRPSRALADPVRVPWPGGRRRATEQLLARVPRGTSLPATSGSYSQSKRSPLLDELISVPRQGTIA